MQKNSYYDNHGLSQSFLKQYLSPNPQIITEEPEPDKWYTEKKHFTIGDGVDMQLTTPNLFDEIMFTSELTIEQKPTDKALGVLHLAYEMFKEVPMDYDNCVLKAAREIGWNPKWGDDAIVKNLGKYYEYFEDLKKAEGKVVLTVEDRQKIDSLVIAIRTHENTAGYFRIQHSEQVHIYQLPIYFEERGEDCKALLDMVIVDHKNKTIRPIDFKTMGDTIYMFPKSMRQRRYDIQAAFYTRALQHYKLQQGWEDYRILPFEFIVVSTTDTIVVPIVYQCTIDTLFIGAEGRPPVVKELENGDEVILRKGLQGWNQLLDLHISYREIGYSTHLDLLDGMVSLDWDSKY